jgi:hypothetical protein
MRAASSTTTSSPTGRSKRISCPNTYQGDSGFTAGLSLEEGVGKGELVNDFNDDGVADTTIKSGDIYAIDSYMPHVVAGLGYTAGWGGVKVVGAYDSVWEEYAVKARLDADLSETISGFIMAGWNPPTSTWWT